MMSRRKVERWITVVRFGAIPFALLQATVASGISHGAQVAGWSITAALIAGTVVLWIVLRREPEGRALMTFSIAAQAFDMAIVSAYVIAYSLQQQTLTPEILFIPLIEACVRFAVVGGLVLAAAAAPVVFAFEKIRHDHLKAPFRWDFVLLHIGIEVAIALIVGRLVAQVAVESRAAGTRADEAMALRDELARRVDLLDAANRCARALGSSLELHTAFGSFIRELSGLVPFDRVAIVLAEDGLAQVMATAGEGAETIFPAGSRQPLAGTLLDELLHETQPIYRPHFEPERYEEEREFVRLGLGSRVATPLLTGAKATGMVALVRRGEDAFTPAEIELVGLLGRLVASAVQNIRAYESERRTVDELRRLSTMRADFVSLVSHELRTPMASVIGSARTLQARWRELSSEQRDAFLALIAGETDRLAGLIGEVLDTSRIDAGTFTYSFGDVDLAGLVEETVATAALGQDAVDVVARIPRALPIVRGDGARLRQVLANLVENAVKYSPEGDLVEVRATSVNGRVVVDVTDHGVGIEPDDQRMIFEKFARVSSTATMPGSGLGLYIARAIAQAHGGEIGVASVPGQGATFTLTLPVS